MADSPADPPAGSYRVVRIHRSVTETVIAAASAVAALGLAPGLPPEAWQTRTVLQKDGQDPFEYDTVALLAGGGGGGSGSSGSLGPSTAAFASSAMPGAIIAPITGKTPGSTYAISPNDGRVLLNADNHLIVGLTASTAGTTTNYTVTETTPGGATNTLVVAITPSAAVAPPMTNLIGWYEADSGVSTGTFTANIVGTASYSAPTAPAVTAWADKSGQGNHLVGSNDANAPVLVTLNGNPRVRFQTAAKKLALPAGLSFDNTKLSIYAIVRTAPTFDGSTAAFNPGATVASLFAVGTGGVAGLTYSASQMANRDSNLIRPSAGLYAGEGEELVGVNYGPAGNLASVKLLNGVETALVAKGTNVTATTGGSVGSYTGSANGFIGDYLALLVYADSNPNEAQIRAYAQARFNVGPSATATVPVLLGDGDSQMAGQNVSNSLNDAADNMLMKLARMIGASGVQPKVNNFGVGGQTILQRSQALSAAMSTSDPTTGLIARAAKWVAGSPGYAAPILIVDMGTNSIANGIQSSANGGTQDGTTTLNDLTNYLTTLKNAGWNMARVYVVPIRPRSGSGGGSSYPAYETYRSQYNGGAGSVCAAAGAKWLSQFLSHPAWSLTTSLHTATPPYYQGDDVHQNQRTMGDEASIILAQLKSDGLVP